MDLHPVPFPLYKVCGLLRDYSDQFESITSCFILSVDIQREQLRYVATTQQQLGMAKQFATDLLGPCYIRPCIKAQLGLPLSEFRHGQSLLHGQLGQLGLNDSKCIATRKIQEGVKSITSKHFVISIFSQGLFLPAV